MGEARPIDLLNEEERIASPRGQCPLRMVDGPGTHSGRGNGLVRCLVCRRVRSLRAAIPEEGVLDPDIVEFTLESVLRVAF